MTLRSLPLLALVCLLGSGCPKRLDFGPRGQITDAQILLKLVQEAEERVVSLQGEAKLRVQAPQGAGALGMYVAVARPAQLHLETMDFFGRTEAVLVSDGQRFGLYQSNEHTYVQGPASAENLSRFLPIRLPPRELALLMLGQVPRIPYERVALSVDEKTATYTLVLQSGEVTQTVLVNTLSFRPVRSEVRGTRAYDLLLEDEDEVKGVRISRKVTLIADAAKTTLELKYKDVAVNEPPEATLFDVAPPPDVRVVEVDEAGNPLTPR